MRLVMFLLLVFPVAATASSTGGDPISQLAEFYEVAPREATKDFSRFIDGFRFGYIAMYRRQKMFAAENGFAFRIGDADSEFMSCISSNDPTSAILYRLLEAAKKTPDELLFLWVTGDFTEQCGEKMKAAISDQYTDR